MWKYKTLFVHVNNLQNYPVIFFWYQLGKLAITVRLQTSSWVEFSLFYFIFTSCICNLSLETSKSSRKSHYDAWISLKNFQELQIFPYFWEEFVNFTTTRRKFLVCRQKFLKFYNLFSSHAKALSWATIRRCQAKVIIFTKCVRIMFNYLGINRPLLLTSFLPHLASTSEIKIFIAAFMCFNAFKLHPLIVFKSLFTWIKRFYAIFQSALWQTFFWPLRTIRWNAESAFIDFLTFVH